ncbi:crossover junction endodeoxyribonuclease RuvC [Candidatus Jorgensenbacteria bacterium RIFCSPLOWO2_12_FULL_42_11]|uniref:Crossover junction endodeoxyribonuclease RuvC n=1 Tax=Candidatus Jorgensenbacteria bacterium RIFCSPLOWO2_12_FULL_42_11 TaxID=1798473 RepID=A0A1F6C194_9BACT|nr:MAG: crossover junction endodeoxyribonuclease RuvC [Candidatus Jorgensenbacteria bacterium RIFCSPLOWO2_12_FULL_42_11]
MKILGIDPGSVRVGYGLINQEKNDLKFIRAGLLKISAKDKNRRLLDLEKSFSRLLKKERPDFVALEKLYFVKNQKTALEVGQSRGVLVLLILKNKLPLIEISPSEAKLTVSGDGRASKAAIAKMVGYYLKIDTAKKIDDVTDALALAIAAGNMVNNPSFASQSFGEISLPKPNPRPLDRY